MPPRSSGAGAFLRLDIPRVVVVELVTDNIAIPLVETSDPPAPIELRRAIATIDRVINDYVTNARVGAA